MTSVLLNNKNELRNGWYLLVFLAGLALLLFPSVVTAAHYHHEITMFEQALMIMLITWACQCLRRKHLMEVIGTLNLSWLIQCAFGMAIGSAMILAPALFLAIGNWITWSADPPSVSVVGSLLLTMFAVAVAEELLFRGFLFQRLEAGAGLWIAQIAMGGLFVLTHLGNPGMEGATKLWAVTNIFLASLLFGFAYLRTRSLAMPIGIHFAANISQGLVLGLGVSGTGAEGLLRPQFNTTANWLTGGNFGLEASLPGLAFVVLALVLITRNYLRSVASKDPNGTGAAAVPAETPSAQLGTSAAAL